MIATSVFLTSLAAIAFEILLTRLFSLSQWNHLSFMVISIALFGFAAGGTWLSIYDLRKRGRVLKFLTPTRIAYLNLLFTVSTLFAFLTVNHLELDYYRLPVQPRQAFYLLTAYVTLALPFFFTGIVISGAYVARPQKTGHIYFMNMSGSACGALAPILLLPYIEEGRLMVLSAVLPLMVCFLLGGNRFHDAEAPDRVKGLKGYLPTAIAGLLLIFASLLAFSPMKHLLDIRISDYKALQQLLQFPNVSIFKTTTGITGRVDQVRSPFIRFAPGLSLTYTGALPPQFAAFKDGDGQLICYDPNLNDTLEFARHTLSYAGYILLSNPEHVLIIQNGGGLAIPCAFSADPAQLTVLENNPGFADIVIRHYGLRVIRQSARNYLARSREQFDLIHLENWGTSLPGTSSLSQTYMFTKEALAAYIGHLADKGLLVVSRKLLLPPSNMIRLCATTVEALRSLSIKDPQEHIIILRNWDTYTFILSKKPLTQIDPVLAFARRNNFDLVWPQKSGSATLNKYNKFEQPFHFINIRALFAAYAEGTEAVYFNQYPLDISSQDDNRPFPDKFFRWSKISAIHQITGKRLYTLLLSGEIVIGVVFLEAVVITCFLLVIPFIAVVKAKQRLPFRYMLYFLCVGAGFILFEIFFINTYIRIFGDPVLSFTIVLTALLVFSSTGGILSQRLEASALRHLIWILTVILILVTLLLYPMMDLIMQLPWPLSILVAILLMLPTGILLGIPFPLGMRYLLASPVQRAYAWTINGCASVLASVVAAQIAISSGLRTMMWWAVIAYALAWATCLATLPVLRNKQ